MPDAPQDRVKTKLARGIGVISKIRHAVIIIIIQFQNLHDLCIYVHYTHNHTDTKTVTHTPTSTHTHKHTQTPTHTHTNTHPHKHKHTHYGQFRQYTECTHGSPERQNDHCSFFDFLELLCLRLYIRNFFAFLFK